MPPNSKRNLDVPTEFQTSAAARIWLTRAGNESPLLSCKVEGGGWMKYCTTPPG